MATICNTTIQPLEQIYVKINKMKLKFYPYTRHTATFNKTFQADCQFSDFLNQLLNCMRASRGCRSTWCCPHRRGCHSSRPRVCLRRRHSNPMSVQKVPMLIVNGTSTERTCCPSAYRRWCARWSTFQRGTGGATTGRRRTRYTERSGMCQRKIQSGFFHRIVLQRETSIIRCQTRITPFRTNAPCGFSSNSNLFY